jgi:hypothetical protein
MRSTPEQPRQQERRRQIRGLLLLAFAVLLITMLRRHSVFFTPGWWRLW